jgi:Na+/H+ antiporter NhaC
MDGTSNLIVLFYFGIYGLVAIYSVINRKTNKVKGLLKSKGQVPIAIIGGVGCIAVAFYAIGYTYLTNVFMHPNAANTS